MSNESPTSQPVVINLQNGDSAPPPNTLTKFSDLSNMPAVQGNFSMELKTDDVVAIAVAGAEKQIRARVAELSKISHASSKALTALQEQSAKYLSEWPSLQHSNDTRVPALISAISAFTPTKPTYDYTPATFNPRSNGISSTLNVSTDIGRFSITYNGAVDPAYTDLLTSIKVAESNVIAANRELMAARQALNNVDTLERRARATLATRVLERSGDAGAAMVASLTDQTDVNSLIDDLAS